MSSNKVACPPEISGLYEQKAMMSTQDPSNVNILKDLFLGLDAKDKSCDGQIGPLNVQDREYATNQIASLQLDPLEESKLLGSIWSLPDETPSEVLPKKSYKESIDTVLMSWLEDTLFCTEPSIEIKGTLKEKRDRLNSISPYDASFYNEYTEFVDALYEESGIPILNDRIRKASEQLKQKTLTNKDLEKPTDKSRAFAKRQLDRLHDPDGGIKAVDWDAELRDLSRGSHAGNSSGLSGDGSWDTVYGVSPKTLDLLYEHKRKAEELFVKTLTTEVEVLREGFVRDPSLYWVPLLSILSSDAYRDIERTGAHVSLAEELYGKVAEYATDEADKIFFEIEYKDKIRMPLKKEELQARHEQVSGMISSLQGYDPDYEAKASKYYSTLGRIWYHRYLGEADSFNPNLDNMIAVEEELRDMMNIRRDVASENEIGIYLDNVNAIASVWTDKGGMISHRLWTQGLPAARADIMRLSTITKEAESIANGCILNSGGGQLKETIADIRWKMNGESYIRAGLAKLGLQNINSEQPYLRATNSYKGHLLELSAEYPWLVNDGRITFNYVGSNGSDAHDISQAAFLKSSSMVREVGLPIALSVAGSYFGRVGTVAGGLAGKGANEIINLNDPDVREILSNAKATGIPIISKEFARQLRNENAADWALTGLSSLMMFKFSRGLLSVGRGSVQASFNYVRTGAFTRALSSSIRNLPSAPAKAASLAVRGANRVASEAVNIRYSVPRFFTTSVPGAFSKAGTLNKYGVVNGWTRTKFTLGTSYKGWLGFWNKWGVPIQVIGGAGGMAYDYLPDREFNGWSGPLGASLLINVTYGPLVWGWNPNGGMAGFAWRYGFELIAQSAQGQDIRSPDMKYTTFGMLTAYTLRGVNKVGTLGRPVVKDSPLLKRFARFVERQDVTVPQSVVGKIRIPARSGMVRGDVLRLGKPEKLGPSYLKTVSDGHVLSVTTFENTAKTSRLKVLRKMTGKNGKPVVVEQIIDVPISGRIGRWFSNTTYNNLKEAPIYRIPDKIMGPATRSIAAKYPKLAGINEWWVKLGNKASDATHPIFNFRGSLANSELLPLIGLGGALGGLLQHSDPKYTAALRMGDYGGAYFLQHKVQHLLKIDSFWGNMVGYLLGVPAQKWVLPYLFPTMINKAPGLTSHDGGYFISLENGDLDQANESLMTSITSYCIVHSIPGLGDLWNRFGPFGAVEDSNRRIEEAGAVAFWSQMYERLEFAEKEIEEAFKNVDLEQSHHEAELHLAPNMDMLTNFITKVVRDSEEYIIRGNVPKDPVMLRLHVLELALLKMMINDGTHPFISEYAANAASGIMSMLENIPELHNYDDVRRFTTGLNENVLVDLD